MGPSVYVYRTLVLCQPNERATRGAIPSKRFGSVIQVTLQPFSMEQDHRAVQRVTRPMLGFQSCHAAQRTLVGVALLHMLKKEQGVAEEGQSGRTPAAQCYALAASSPPGSTHSPQGVYTPKLATTPDLTIGLFVNRLSS